MTASGRSLIIVEEEAVALIERPRTRPLYSLFPGGGVEPAETPHVAATGARCARNSAWLTEVGAIVVVAHYDDDTHSFFRATMLDSRFGSGDGERPGGRDGRGRARRRW